MSQDHLADARNEAGALCSARASLSQTVWSFLCSAGVQHVLPCGRGRRMGGGVQGDQDRGGHHALTACNNRQLAGHKCRWKWVTRMHTAYVLISVRTHVHTCPANHSAADIQALTSYEDFMQALDAKCEKLQLPSANAKDEWEQLD